MNEGLNKSELQLLAKANTVLELIALPIKDGGRTVWALDVVLSNGDTKMLTRTRLKDKHRIWKQLSALHRFVLKAAPEIDQFTVLSFQSGQRENRHNV